MLDTNQTLINELVSAYSKIYAALYDGTLRLPNGYAAKLIDRFDGGGCFAYDYDRDVLRAFNKARQDIISSDREVVAFMLAYERCAR